MRGSMLTCSQLLYLMTDYPLTQQSRAGKGGIAQHRFELILSFLVALIFEQFLLLSDSVKTAILIFLQLSLKPLPSCSEMFQ